jgi:hypothetical protein
VVECIERATQNFNMEIKPSFENNSEDYVIAVAERRFSNAGAGIERGYMALKG